MVYSVLIVFIKPKLEDISIKILRNDAIYIIYVIIDVFSLYILILIKSSGGVSGVPQLGHTSALSLILCEHSLQLINDISSPLFYI